MTGQSKGLTKNDSSVQLDQGETKLEVPIHIFENPWPEELEKEQNHEPQETEETQKSRMSTKESPNFKFSKAKKKICGFGGKVQRKMILGKLNVAFSQKTVFFSLSVTPVYVVWSFSYNVCISTYCGP